MSKRNLDHMDREESIKHRRRKFPELYPVLPVDILTAFPKAGAIREYMDEIQAATPMTDEMRAKNQSCGHLNNIFPSLMSHTNHSTENKKTVLIPVGNDIIDELAMTLTLTFLKERGFGIHGFMAKGGNNQFTITW